VVEVDGTVVAGRQVFQGVSGKNTKLSCGKSQQKETVNRKVY